SAVDGRSVILRSIPVVSPRSRAPNNLIGDCWRVATFPGLPMRSIHLAEWILALVTSRDRASSTAGDLAERAAARGAVSFWFAVLRTLASLLWRDVTEKPARPAVLAFAGLAVLVAVAYLGAAVNGAVLFSSAHPLGRAP